MKTFETKSAEGVLAFFQHASIAQIQQQAPSLPCTFITLGIQALQNCPKGHEKMRATIQVLQELPQLEACGRGLSTKQFIYLLKSFQQHQLAIEKLSPILVGLPPYVFFQVLYNLPASHIDILKIEGLLEPLQHHLHLFTHECEQITQQYRQDVLHLYQRIQELHREELNHRNLQQMSDQILAKREQYKTLLNTLNKALAIAWPTNRLDLLDKLNQQKETLYHHFIQSVGAPRSGGIPPTGLFLALEKFLFNTFTTEDGTIDSLYDDELAIEGLAKLSIWYLKDYWELGLLPSIHSIEELELDPNQFSEKERLQHRQKLFNLVQDNLSQIGIKIVRDLKQAQIFSKNMLKEYIDNHNDLLPKNPGRKHSSLSKEVY